VNSRSIIALLCLSVLPSRLLGVSVMINEYGNGNGAVTPGTSMASNEFIEFVIVESTSSATLSAMTFGGTNDATSLMQGVFSFDKATLDTALANASLTAFVPGTIIVVKGTGLGAQDLTYNPFNNTTDSWKIELVAGQGAKDHPETLINGNISVGNNGEVIWISTDNPPTRNTDTSSLVHAIGHDNNPGLIANTVAATFGAENILRSTVATGRSVANVGDTTESLVSTTTQTMGVANGGTNSTWITSTRLAAIPEPHRAALLALGLALGTLRRSRSKSHRHG